MPFAPEYLHLVVPGVRFEAFLYGRNSDDAIGSGSSVEDQLANGRTLSHDNNWRIVEEFNDTDISASRHGKKVRSRFEALLDTITNDPPPPNVRRIVVAFEASRYYRDLEAYVRLRKACMATGTFLCYNGQVYDLSRRDDRKATAMHAVDAEDEAEGIRDRNLRTMRRTATEGMPHGKTIFGYTRTYKTVGGRRRCTGQVEDPIKGPYVLAALHHIDADKSAGSLIRWLNSEPGAKRSNGAPWDDRKLRLMLLNRTYLGERMFQGQWVQAAWEPIKGLETAEGRAMFNRVTAKLTDPDRTTHRGTDVKHLLSHIGLCGECGDHAVLDSQSPGKQHAPSLQCKEKSDTSIKEALIDAYVEEAIVEWFCDKKKSRAALIPSDDKAKKDAAGTQRLINAYEEQLAEARQMAETYDEETGRFKMSAASLASLEFRLVPKLEAARRKLKSQSGISPVLLTLLEARDPDLVWNGDPEVGVPGITLEQKREVIRSVVTVRLYRARASGRRRLDGDRIRLSFFGEPGFRAQRLRVPGPVGAGVPAGGRG
jgi:site-specific DNA recombinase